VQFVLKSIVGLDLLLGSFFWECPFADGILHGGTEHRMATFELCVHYSAVSVNVEYNHHRSFYSHESRNRGIFRTRRLESLGRRRISCETLILSNAPTDGNEEATFVRKGTNPSKLCQPALKAPVVFGSSEQLLRMLT